MSSLVPRALELPPLRSGEEFGQIGFRHFGKRDTQLVALRREIPEFIPDLFDEEVFAGIGELGRL